MKISKETKESYAVISALIMLGFSMVLTVAGFIIDPKGQVHDSVLYVLAQCLFYAGSIFGITMYTKQRYDEIRSEVDRLRSRIGAAEDEVECENS